MILVIGDIHGMLTKFKLLLAEAKPTKDDTIVILGDVIDRGDDSKGVIDLILKLQAKGYNVITLMGNHEEMYMNCLDAESRNLPENELNDFLGPYIWNGGAATLRSFDFKPPSKKYMDFFISMPLYHETEDYIFVHAGLKAGVPLEKQKSEDLLWIREDFIYSKHDFGKLVIFGHTPFDKPFFKHNRLGIDTGAVFKGGKLTGVILPDMETISI